MATLTMPGREASTRRFAAIDVLRGIALLAMIVYHFSWDLSAYGFIAVDVGSDPGWRIFSHAIAGTFLALVGFNLVLAQRNGFRRGPYLRRLAILAVAAGLVSLGTYFFVPDGFVYFGILHEIFVASILALPFLRARFWITAVVAVACLFAPDFLTSPAFDSPALAWLGLAADPIASVDYVPILPWFGVVLGGVASGRLFLDQDGEAVLAAIDLSGGFWRGVAFIGRWSLAVYLIHQPILLGLLYIAVTYFGFGG